MIEVHNLSKQYGVKLALQDVTLSFAPGLVHGIVGENGAGKSTLFRCMAGLEVHDGDITSDRKPLKNHLGLLLTEPYFFSKITGAEYIRLLCNARHVVIDDIEAQNIFELPLGEYAAVYSTGMKKKLALTAILLQGNSYFILDEPFNGVDIQSNMIITGIIQKLKSLNKTVILSSHIFSTLHETCDIIHLLHHGKLMKTVDRSQFAELEAEMKQVIVGDKVERLRL